MALRALCFQLNLCVEVYLACHNNKDWSQAENRVSFVGRTRTTSIPCRASAPMRELKSPDLQHQVCQPARAQPGEACHHYHRGLHSSPQRQSQKCTAAIQGIPSIQISTSDIILGFCEPVLWFTRRAPPPPYLPFVPLRIEDSFVLWCKDIIWAAHPRCKVPHIVIGCQLVTSFLKKFMKRF